MLRHSLMFAAALSVGMIAHARVSHAGSQILPPYNTCTSTNCGAQVLSGTYQFDQYNQANPFIAQIYASSGECLRIDVYAEDTDMELTLIAPSGSVYSNDDRAGASDRRPLLKVSTGSRGWYTVQVAQYAGIGPGANFSMAYSRYNSGNPNCATPTVPHVAAALSAKR